MYRWTLELWTVDNFLLIQQSPCFFCTVIWRLSTLVLYWELVDLAESFGWAISLLWILRNPTLRWVLDRIEVIRGLHLNLLLDFFLLLEACNLRLRLFALLAPAHLRRLLVGSWTALGFFMLRWAVATVSLKDLWVIEWVWKPAGLITTTTAGELTAHFRVHTTESAEFVIVNTPAICNAWNRTAELVNPALINLLRWDQLIRLEVAVALKTAVVLIFVLKVKFAK